MTSDLLTLSQAAKQLPRINGRKVHTSTLWRWCRRGCKGVRLQYYRIGRSIMVSQATLNRFFTELVQADAADQSPTAAPRKRRSRRTTSAMRQREIDAANKVLIKAGIMKPKEAEAMAVEKIGGGR